MTFLEWIGLIAVVLAGAKILVVIVGTVYRFVIGPSLGLNTNLKKMGQWAVVTGSTDGIGKAYAEELAKLGINIVLISRSQDKLQAVAKDLETKHNIQTKLIAVDFTGGIEIYNKMREELVNLEIGILINNVGISYSYPEYFLEIPDGENTCLSLINCNIVSVTMMTRLVLPQMVIRGKGVVVNVASLAAVAPTPLMCVYGASKAFVDKFTRDLQVEYKGKGIIVQGVLPAYVATNMSKIHRPSLMTPSASQFVRSAMKTIGLQDRTSGYLPHDIFLAGVELSNAIFPMLSMNNAFKSLLDIRARALRKIERMKQS